MPNTKYQVHLCLDGQHSVSVQSADQSAVTEALVWAKKTYEQLVRYQRQQDDLGTSQASRATDGVPAAPDDPERAEEPPICAGHDLPMVRVQGRQGAFWSCHEKMPDGSWCSYKPIATR